MVIDGGKRIDVADKERATDGALSKRNVNYSKQTDADLIRDLLLRADLSQRGAARELDIDERTMRRYCSGELPVPKVVKYALQFLELRQRSTADTSRG